MLDTQLWYSGVTVLHQGPSITERWWTTWSQTVKPSAMQGLLFPLSAREEREDSSPWEVKGAFLRGSQSCGWAWVMFLFSPLQGHWAALEASRWSIHSPCPMLTIQKSYDNNKLIFFFWGKLACITGSTSKLYQAGFPQHLGAAEILMQIYNLALFQVVFLHTLAGGKNLIYNTIRVFCCFYKIFQDITKLHTL